jgi:hypothetical protein
MHDETTALDLGCGEKPKNLFQASNVYGIDLCDDLANNVGHLEKPHCIEPLQ